MVFIEVEGHFVNVSHIVRYSLEVLPNDKEGTFVHLAHGHRLILFQTLPTDLYQIINNTIKESNES